MDRSLLALVLTFSNADISGIGRRRLFCAVEVDSDDVDDPSPFGASCFIGNPKCEVEEKEVLGINLSPTKAEEVSDEFSCRSIAVMTASSFAPRIGEHSDSSGKCTWTSRGVSG
mmetsp:Transcript_50500/g.56426  ORF Transcript_50500/g.56426 Transcript_50500/m.56426 type:complete len:114 (-) Transcript_50500:2219-2560(-)